MSAALLGCYDSLKKHALRGNAVIPVLFLNTLFSSIIFLPFIILSGTTDVLDGGMFHVSSGGWEPMCLMEVCSMCRVAVGRFINTFCLSRLSCCRVGFWAILA